MLGVLCGLRRGEAVAVRWRSGDLDGKQVSVVGAAKQAIKEVRLKPPKSGPSRTVRRSGFFADARPVHRARQAEALRHLGIRQGHAFVDTREDGEPIQPRTPTHQRQVLVAEVGLPRVRFHDLRHAHATPMLASGLHPKMARERLGHPTVRITRALFNGVLPGMRDDAAPALTTPCGAL